MAMLRDVKQRQRAEAEARLPLPRSDLTALFDFIDSRLGSEGCDHTLRLTRELLRERSVPGDGMLGVLCYAEQSRPVTPVYRQAPVLSRAPVVFLEFAISTCMTELNVARATELDVALPRH